MAKRPLKAIAMEEKKVQRNLDLFLYLPFFSPLKILAQNSNQPFSRSPDVKGIAKRTPDP